MYTVRVSTCYGQSLFDEGLHALRECRDCVRKRTGIMAELWHMVYLWTVCNLQAAAFNLDTQNVLQRREDPGGLFGFSVAFHQQLKPARRNL